MLKKLMITTASLALLTSATIAPDARSNTAGTAAATQPRLR